MPTRRGTAVLVCTVVLSAGCASIPTDGPVIQGEGFVGGEDQGNSLIRLVPVPPQSGIEPAGLVREFLASMGSVDNEFDAARAYMTPEQASEWRPNGNATRVYDGTEPVELDVSENEEAGTAQVELSAQQIAAIGADGQFRAAESGLDSTFQLRQVDGEWRISDLPEDLILASHDVDRIYRPLNLYYFAPQDPILVPDTVLLPLQPTADLASQLVNHLADGPTAWLDPAVATEYPSETEVSTAYRAGQLTVDLEQVGSMPESGERYRMAAQLAWTLRQLPEVQEFRIRIDGEEISIPGGGTGWQGISSTLWDNFDPAGLSEESRAYVMREGHLLALNADLQEEALPGAAGSGDLPIERYAVSVDEELVAGISPAEGVLLAELAQGGAFAPVLNGGEYTSLSWSGSGHLWVVEALDGDRSQLWMLRRGEQPVEVDAPELEGVTIRELRMSRDGTRAAVLVEEDEEVRLVLARIIDDGERVELGGLIPVASDIDEFRDVAWRSGDQLAVLGRSGPGAAQAYLVSTGGSVESTSAGVVTGAGMQTIAAAPGAPLFAGADDDHIWLTSDRLMWQRGAEGANPVYPG